MIGHGTVTGAGIVLAQRLEQLAEPGGVVVHGAVYDATPRRIPVDYRNLGERELKGFDEPVRAFAACLRPGETLAPSAGDDIAEVDASEPVAERKALPSIIVLPFRHTGADASQEYLADGITEDLITALSKYRSLVIAARNTAFAYKNQTYDVREIGAELDVQFVVEGSVRMSGKRVRITAEMVDAETGNQLWAERYDHELDDLFDLQDEITSTIAARVEPEVGAAERERVHSKPPRSLDAWDKYHLAFSKVYQYTKAANDEAGQLFAEAIVLDPNFGSAHMGLAYTLYLDVLYFDAPVENDLLDRALAEAQRAVALDDRDAMHHFILGRVHLIRKEYDLSIGDLKTAIALNPYMATAHCGLGDSLAFSGRFAEAVPHFEDAVRLGPRDTRRWAILTYGSFTLMELGRYEESIEWCQEAVRLPNSIFWCSAQLVAALARAGYPERAEAAAKELVRREPGFSSKDFANRFLFYIADKSLIQPYVDTLLSVGLRA